MALTTPSRFDEPFFSFSDLDRIFDDAFGSIRRGSLRRGLQDESGAIAPQNGGGRSNTLWPRLNLYEDEGQNVVTATLELPGLRKEDIALDFQSDKNQIVISGNSGISSKKEENGYVVRERRTGRFARALPVSPGIKPEDVKAAMKNGVLTITYPRLSEERRAKRIEIS